MAVLTRPASGRRGWGSAPAPSVRLSLLLLATVLLLAAGGSRADVLSSCDSGVAVDPGLLAPDGLPPPTLVSWQAMVAAHGRAHCRLAAIFVHAMASGETADPARLGEAGLMLSQALDQSLVGMGQVLATNRARGGIPAQFSDLGAASLARAWDLLLDELVARVHSRTQAEFCEAVAQGLVGMTQALGQGQLGMGQVLDQVWSGRPLPVTAHGTPDLTDPELLATVWFILDHHRLNLVLVTAVRQADGDVSPGAWLLLTRFLGQSHLGACQALDQGFLGMGQASALAAAEDQASLFSGLPTRPIRGG